jgi:hypothetical protein
MQLDFLLKKRKFDLISFSYKLFVLFRLFVYMSYSKIISSQSCYQCAKKNEENKRNQRTEKIEPYVCFFSRHEYLKTYVQRDTKREREKATVCLARPTKREREKR